MITLDDLAKWADSASAVEFIRMVGPVLLLHRQGTAKSVAPTTHAPTGMISREALRRLGEGSALSLDPTMAVTPIRHSDSGTSVLKVGRGKTNDLVLTESAASKEHAVLTFTDGVCTVKDLGSRNGTFVNGTFVTLGASVTLNDRDVVSFATTQTVFYRTAKVYEIFSAKRR